MPKIEFQLYEDKIIEKLPSYAFDPVLNFWSSLCKDKISIYPLTIPNSNCIQAFCICHNDETLVIVNPYISDSFHGAVVDIASNKLPQDKLGELKEISYKLILGDEDYIESKDLVTMPERRLKELGKLRTLNNWQTSVRFIVFTEKLISQVEDFALSTLSESEKLGAIETELFWDPEIKIPWIFADNLIPFTDIVADSVFVQVRGGENSTSFIRAIDKPVSLVHTHLMDESEHAKCFFSETDKSTLRKHLTNNQFSLVCNFVYVRKDLGCIYHLYTLNGSGSIIRENFYIAEI